MLASIILPLAALVSLLFGMMLIAWAIYDDYRNPSGRRWWVLLTCFAIAILANSWWFALFCIVFYKLVILQEDP